ncbi:MAG: nucleoside-diphosphate kinase, partial [Burkholderiales bacterium]|nr:nucleoside-diphosphate kinase [Burkholderiales bacterium]
MAKELTLSIIKPDGVKNNHIGEIIATFEKNGLHIAAAKLIHMSQAVASGFYAVHSARPFFKDLVGFMTSGPSLVLV